MVLLVLSYGLWCYQKLCGERRFLSKKLCPYFVLCMLAMPGVGVEAVARMKARRAFSTGAACGQSKRTCCMLGGL